MSRFFTIEQATRVLPEVEKALRDLIRHKADHDEADAALKALSHRISVSGGMNVRHDEVSGLRQRAKTSVQLLKARFEEIQEIGCLIKDLDLGLIDFPTLYRGREVYLCWHFGEPVIEYWHGTDEGFAGRKKIDTDFLDHHRGDAN